VAEYWEERRRVYDALGMACKRCGRYHPLGMHVDHIDASQNPFKSSGAGTLGRRVGFCGWDQGIGHAIKLLKAGSDLVRTFQLLCGTCHTIKTNEERKEAKAAGQIDMFVAGMDDDIDFWGRRTKWQRS
jgi:hypothetical protein